MKNLRKATSVLLVLMMLFSIMPAAHTVSAAASFSDFPTGWSAEAMQSAVDNGLMFGKDNGTIGPQDMLTRSEAAAIINRAFGATVKADLSSYTDVSTSDWYYDEFAKAVNMDTIVGDGNGKLNPEGNITREEIFAVMARSLVLTGGSSSTLSRFSDASQVSSWASAHVCALVDGGYINGNADGTLNPKGNITREEFAQMMHNIFRTYISSSGTVTKVGANCVMIRTPGVTLKDVTVEGDLVLGDGVGAGDIVLDNVTIKGRLLCRGGEGSVKLKNTTVGDKVVVYDVNGTVNFLNYEDEKPFEGKELHTPATFLKRKPTGGGSSRPSTSEYAYKIVYHIQGADGVYATGYTTLDRYGFAKLGTTVTLAKGTDFDETLTMSGRTYKYTDKLGNTRITITNSSSANVINLYYNMVYNYTFDLDGGNIDGDTSSINGTYTVDDASITMPATPEKEGYIFKGWVTVDAGGNKTPFTYIPGTTVGDLTIKADWELKTPGVRYYKITTVYDSAKTGMTASVTDLNNVEEGTNVTITFNPKNGYKITSITSANGKGVVSGNTVTYTAVDADDTVTVVAEAIQYNYSFDLDGGTQTDTKPLSGTYTVETTDDFTPANPTKSDYDFVKWVYVSGGTGDFVFSAGMTGDIVVKAVWKSKGTIVEEGTLKFVPTYDDTTGVVTMDVTLDRMPGDITNIHSITIDYSFEGGKLDFDKAVSAIDGRLDASASKISWFEPDAAKGLTSASFGTAPLKLFTLKFNKKAGAEDEVNFKFTVNATTPSVTDFDGKKSEKIKTVDGKVDLGKLPPVTEDEGTLKFVPTYDDTTGVVTMDVTLDRMPGDITNIHSITIDYSFEGGKLDFDKAVSAIDGRLDASASKISWFEPDAAKGLTSASFGTAPLKLFTLKFNKKAGAEDEVNFKFTVNATTPSVTDFDGKKSEKIKTVDGKVDLGTVTPETKFKVNLYDGSNAVSENFKGSVEVLANEKITQEQIGAVLGAPRKKEGYKDNRDNVLHYISPELWYNNGTDWVIFDTDMPITKDIDVCRMFRTISIYVQDDVYLDGSVVPGITKLGFTLVYDSESSIAESALDAMHHGKTLLKSVLSALESRDVYVYDELLQKLESKGIIDSSRKILNQSVTLKMADFLTVKQIEGEVDKYIEENIDNDEFIKKILSNRSVVDSMLANESLKKTFMNDATLRDKLVNDDDFIKELASDEDMVDTIIASDSFKKSFIEKDATLEYILTSDALKDYIQTNADFRKFLVDESIQYVKDVYFNGTETDATVKKYIDDKLKENGAGSIRDELYANDTVKQTVKNWLKEKLDNDPSELLTNATFKNHVRQKVREGLTNGDPEIKAIVKDNLRDYNKVGTKLKELLLGDDTFPAEIKSDVKNLIDGDVTLKNNIRDDLKADDNVKARAETRIKDELVAPSSTIRAKALTELKDDIKTSSEFSNYVSSDGFKNKVRSAEFKNKMTSLSVDQKLSILNKLKDTVDPTQYQSQIKRLMSKDDIKNIIQAQGATVSDAELDAYLNGTLDAATSAQYDQHLADGYASNKDTIFALANFDTVVNGFCGSDEIFNISGSAFITELTNTAFDICYDEDMFNACIDSYLGTPANFNKVYDKYFNDYFDLYFDTVYGEYYDEVANDKTKFADFYDKYAADYIKDNFDTLYDSHFDSFYDRLAGSQDYQDAMDQYMNDNFDDLYANNIVNYYRTYCDDEQFNKYFDEFYADKDNFDDYYDNHVSEVVRDTYNNPANTEVIRIVNDYLNIYVGEIVDKYAANTLDADMADAINNFIKSGVKEKIRNKYNTDANFRSTMSNLIETNAKEYVKKYVNNDPSLTDEQRKMIKDAIAEYADDIADEYVNGTISAENKKFVDERIEKYVDSAITKYLNGTDDTIKTLIQKHAKTAIDAYKETKAYKDLMADFAAKKGDITINKDNLVLARGIADAVRGYTYDKIKAEFIPSKYYKAIELIDEDVVRRYVMQATKDFADGLDAKCDIVESSSDANITETYPASLTAVVDIMNDWVVPYYNKFVKKATDKLKSVPEVDYDNNTKLKELAETNWLEKFFERTTDGAYRLKLNSIEQYYDVVYDAAVIAHDALIYYNKFDDATIESKTKAAAAILATYANKANEIIMNYITKGELPKGLTLDKILDVNYRLRNLYNKHKDKIETALDKYEQYLNRDYAKVFDKLSTATIAAEGERFKATDAALEIKVGGKLFGIDSAFDALLSGNNTVSDTAVQEKIDKVVNKIKSAKITPAPAPSKIYVDAYRGTVSSRTLRGHETGDITVEVNRYLQ